MDCQLRPGVLLSFRRMICEMNEPSPGEEEGLVTDVQGKGRENVNDESGRRARYEVNRGVSQAAGRRCYHAPKLVR